MRGVKLSDEARRLNLVNDKGQRRALIELRCSGCGRPHPDNPAALMWFKMQLQKGMLKCVCGGKNFVRTNSTKTQGELISDVIENKSKFIKQYITNEVGSSEDGKRFIRVPEAVLAQLTLAGEKALKDNFFKQITPRQVIPPSQIVRHRRW